MTPVERLARAFDELAQAAARAAAAMAALAEVARSAGDR